MAQLTVTGCGLCWPHLGQNQPFELGGSPEQALPALRNDVRLRHTCLSSVNISIQLRIFTCVFSSRSVNLTQSWLFKHDHRSQWFNLSVRVI